MKHDYIYYEKKKSKMMDNYILPSKVSILQLYMYMVTNTYYIPHLLDFGSYFYLFMIKRLMV